MAQYPEGPPIREEFKHNSSEVYVPIRFAGELARDFRSARNRAWSQAMYVEMGHATGIIANALEIAGSHRADARLNLDYFSVAEVNNKIAASPKFGEARNTQREIQLENKQMLERLDKAGVLVSILNKTRLARVAPFFGRDHRKIHIADNVAWFGGVNLEADHFKRADFMVRLKDPAVVEALAAEYLAAGDNRSREDYKKECTQEYTVFSDSGRPGSSIIYREAIDMVKKADTSIKYMSQFPPGGELLKEIKQKAAQGLQVSIVLPAKRHLADSNNIPFGLLSKRSYKLFMRAVSEYPNVELSHFEGHNGRLHAKMIIVDENKAMWGSHNLVFTGVMAGTQETDIQTTDQDLVKKLVGVHNSIKNGTFDLGYQEVPSYLQAKTIKYV